MDIIDPEVDYYPGDDDDTSVPSDPTKSSKKEATQSISKDRNEKTTPDKTGKSKTIPNQEGSRPPDEEGSRPPDEEGSRPPEEEGSRPAKKIAKKQVGKKKVIYSSESTNPSKEEKPIEEWLKPTNKKGKTPSNKPKESQSNTKGSSPPLGNSDKEDRESEKRRQELEDLAQDLEEEFLKTRVETQSKEIAEMTMVKPGDTRNYYLPKHDISRMPDFTEIEGDERTATLSIENRLIAEAILLKNYDDTFVGTLNRIEKIEGFGDPKAFYARKAQEYLDEKSKNKFLKPLIQNKKEFFFNKAAEKGKDMNNMAYRGFGLKRLIKELGYGTWIETSIDARFQNLKNLSEYWRDKVLDQKDAALPRDEWAPGKKERIEEIKKALMQDEDFLEIWNMLENEGQRERALTLEIERKSKDEDWKNKRKIDTNSNDPREKKRARINLASTPKVSGKSATQQSEEEAEDKELQDSLRREPEKRESLIAIWNKKVTTSRREKEAREKEVEKSITKNTEDVEPIFDEDAEMEEKKDSEDEKDESSSEMDTDEEEVLEDMEERTSKLTMDEKYLELLLGVKNNLSMDIRDLRTGKDFVQPEVVEKRTIKGKNQANIEIEHCILKSTNKDDVVNYLRSHFKTFEKIETVCEMRIESASSLSTKASKREIKTAIRIRRDLLAELANFNSRLSDAVKDEIRIELGEGTGRQITKFAVWEYLMQLIKEDQVEGTYTYLDFIEKVRHIRQLHWKRIEDEKGPKVTIEDSWKNYYIQFESLHNIFKTRNSALSERLKSKILLAGVFHHTLRKQILIWICEATTGARKRFVKTKMGQTLEVSMENTYSIYAYVRELIRDGLDNKLKSDVSTEPKNLLYLTDQNFDKKIGVDQDFFNMYDLVHFRKEVKEKDKKEKDTKYEKGDKSKGKGTEYKKKEYDSGSKSKKEKSEKTEKRENTDKGKEKTTTTAPCIICKGTDHKTNDCKQNCFCGWKINPPTKEDLAKADTCVKHTPYDCHANEYNIATYKGKKHNNDGKCEICEDKSRGKLKEYLKSVREKSFKPAGREASKEKGREKKDYPKKGKSKGK